METTSKFLGALLGAQLLLALWALSGGPELAARQPEQPLIGFDRASVSEIRISGAQGEEVHLRKQANGWILPDAWEAPANAVKVDGFLQRLQDLQRGLAVATSAAAQTRFEVADEQYQRRIGLLDGERPIATVYLGTSPGLRKTHARTGDDERIYAVNFAVYEAPDKTRDWLDSRLLTTRLSDLAGIELDGLRLDKVEASKGDGEPPAGGDAWRASGLAQGEQLDQAKVEALANRLSQIEVRNVLGTQAPSEPAQGSPVLTLRLQPADAQPIEWVISQPQQEGADYILKASNHPWYFEVAAWKMKPLLESAKREALLLDGEAAGTPPTGETDAARSQTPQQPPPPAAG